MPREKYNIGDDDLYLWRCHPERLCINCIHLSICPEDEERYFTMQCEHNEDFWMYYPTGSYGDKTNLIKVLLTSRNCGGFELNDDVH